MHFCTFTDDHTRVKLEPIPNDPGNDYINACYISVRFKASVYICILQQPLVNKRTINYNSKYDVIPAFPGLQQAACVHRGPGADGGVRGGLLAHGVAAEVPQDRHAYSPRGTQQGKGTTLICVY